jgi:hypothetical protein
VLARAHAKAGGVSEIAGYLGSSDQFDEAMGHFAVAYADQTERALGVEYREADERALRGRGVREVELLLQTRVVHAAKGAALELSAKLARGRKRGGRERACRCHVDRAREARLRQDLPARVQEQRHAGSRVVDVSAKRRFDPRFRRRDDH